MACLCPPINNSLKFGRFQRLNLIYVLCGKTPSLGDSYSGSVCGLCLRCGYFCAVFVPGEAVRRIAGLNDCAVTRSTIAVVIFASPKTGPFPELQISRDDGTYLPVELADQMKQKRATGFGERDVARLIDDNVI